MPPARRKVPGSGRKGHCVGTPVSALVEYGEALVAGGTANPVPVDPHPQGHVPRIAPVAVPNVMIPLRHKLHLLSPHAVVFEPQSSEAMLRQRGNKVTFRKTSRAAPDANPLHMRRINRGFTGRSHDLHISSVNTVPADGGINRKGGLHCHDNPIYPPAPCPPLPPQPSRNCPPIS